MVEETTFEKLKKALLELLLGYPEYAYYGKCEFYLTNTKEKSVDLLLRHKIIEELPKKEVKKLKVNDEEKKRRWYRLAPRGVDLAISMINLEHSENILKYAKETHKFNKRIIFLTAGLFIIGLAQLILIYLQHPIF